MTNDRYNLALFSYNFPHNKTQDLLLRVVLGGIRPALVLAADFVSLDIPSPTIRVKPRHVDLVHPREICKFFNIEYIPIEHNSPRCSELIKSHHIDIGLITGARILIKDTLESVKRGIINLHPGLLPQIRGMDALQWAIYRGERIGVTAHLVNEKIDHGLIIKRVIIPEYKDDTLIDLSLRLEETQNNIVLEAIQMVSTYPIESFKRIQGKYPLNKKMPPELEAQLPGILANRLLKLGLEKDE